MKVVVDTNVLAYFLLRTEPFFEEARSFWFAAREAWAPDSWRIELLNVLFLAVRAGVIDQPRADRYWSFAQKLITHTCPLPELARASLRLAVDNRHPAYDTVFVALAIEQRAPLATFDRKVMERFPEQATRPKSLISRDR